MPSAWSLSRPSTQSRTWVGSTRTTLCIPSSLQPSSCRIGMVANATEPAASFCSCWMKSMMSQPSESTTERWTASCSRFRVDGLDSVLPEMTSWASDAITDCWRVTRSRSPRGRSWRCRTKLSACGPFSFCHPAGKSAPDSGS